MGADQKSDLGNTGSLPLPDEQIPTHQINRRWALQDWSTKAQEGVAQRYLTSMHSAASSVSAFCSSASSQQRTLPHRHR